MKLNKKSKFKIKAQLFIFTTLAEVPLLLTADILTPPFYAEWGILFCAYQCSVVGFKGHGIFSRSKPLLMMIVIAKGAHCKQDDVYPIHKELYIYS